MCLSLGCVKAEPELRMSTRTLLEGKFRKYCEGVKKQQRKGRQANKKYNKKVAPIVIGLYPAEDPLETFET